MNEWILFTIGIFIGGMVGVMAIALVSAGKTADLYREIEDLRTTRILLKEEIFKLDKMTKARKPTPRKYRKKQK